MYPIYSSQTKDRGIMGYVNTYDFDVTQLTWTTDGANAGTVFLREGRHNCTNVCGTLQPKTKEFDMHFAEYAIGYVSFFNKRPDTNGYKIMNNEMANILFAVPPIEEQINISTFLNTITIQFNKFIIQKERLILELESYKKSLIYEVVTGKKEIV
jgi:type I restriction enzyme S subunit